MIASVELRDTRVVDLDVPDLVKSRLYERGWFLVDDFIDRPGDELRAAIGQACLIRLREAFSAFGFIWSAAEIQWNPSEAERKTPLWPRDRRRRAVAWVYFVRCAKFVKIGVATDVSIRFQGLQTGNPYRLRLWLAIPCDSVELAYRLESQLHERFTSSRERGEWFRLSTEIVRFIKTERMSARPASGTIAA